MRFISTTSLLGYLLIAAHCWGEDEPSADQLGLWIDFYKQRAAEYEITGADGATVNLQLHREPLLTYTNPIRGRDQHGALFVWTDAGRPLLIGSLWSIANLNNQAIRRTAHEIHSLADSPLSVACPQVEDPSATRARALSWTLEPTPSSEQIVIDWARPPGPSAALRMVQMRRIAGELSGLSIDRGDGSERPLRLMSTPLLRYESKAAGVMDGCLFAYVLATDPEILLAIEALDEGAGDGSIRWRALPARLTGTELRLSHGDEEAWRVDKIDYQSQTGPYRLQIGVTELPATRDDPN